MQTNHIYQGECVKILTSEIDAQSVDLIFADPPYNLSGKGLKLLGNTTGGDWYKVNEKWDTMTTSDYEGFTRDWISACKRVLKPRGSIYISCSYHNLGEVLMAAKGIGFEVKNLITWQKSNPMPNLTRRTFAHSTEFVVWATLGKGWQFNYEQMKEANPDRKKDGSLKQMRDVWTLPVVQGKERLHGSNGRALHPTQKPEELLRRIILASSNEGDLVLDPFIGSGTTGVVAKRLNRSWIGIERDARYVTAAAKRINEEN